MNETGERNDGPLTEEERAAARRELARMPDDLRRKVHDIAHARRVDTVDGLAWFIREEREQEPR